MTHFDPFTQQLLDSLEGALIKSTYETAPLSKLETDTFILLLESKENRPITAVFKKRNKMGQKSLRVEEYELCLELHTYDCVSRMMTQERRDFWEKDEHNQLEDYRLYGVGKYKYEVPNLQSPRFDEVFIYIAHPERDNITMINSKGKYADYNYISLTTYIEEEDEISPFFEKGEKRVFLNYELH